MPPDKSGFDNLLISLLSIMNRNVGVIQPTMMVNPFGFMPHPCCEVDIWLQKYEKTLNGLSCNVDFPLMGMNFEMSWF